MGCTIDLQPGHYSSLAVDFASFVDFPGATMVPDVLAARREGPENREAMALGDRGRVQLSSVYRMRGSLFW